MQWIILTNYATKYQVSVSTIRRSIKNGQLEHRFVGGKYLLLDEPLQNFESTNSSDDIEMSIEASHIKAPKPEAGQRVNSGLLADKFRATVSAVQDLATSSGVADRSKDMMIQARDAKLNSALQEFDRDQTDITELATSSDDREYLSSGVESSFAPSKRRSAPEANIENQSVETELISERQPGRIESEQVVLQPKVSYKQELVPSEPKLSVNLAHQDLFATDEEINVFRLPGFVQTSAYHSSPRFDSAEDSTIKASEDIVEDFQMPTIISELRPLTEQAESQIKSMKTPEPMIASATKVLADLKRAYASVLHEKEEQIIQLKEEVSDLKTLVRALESENTRRYPTQSAL
jgi:hypothetical protein